MCGTAYSTFYYHLHPTTLAEKWMRKVDLPPFSGLSGLSSFTAKLAVLTPLTLDALLLEEGKGFCSERRGVDGSSL